MQKQGRDRWECLQITQMMRTDAILAQSHVTGTPNMSQSRYESEKRSFMAHPTRCATSCTFRLRRTLQWAYAKKNTTTLPSEWIRRRTFLIKNLNVLVPPLSILYQKRGDSGNSNTQLWWSKPSIARKSVPPVPAVTGPDGTRWARGRQNFLLSLL